MISSSDYDSACYTYLKWNFSYNDRIKKVFPSDGILMKTNRKPNYLKEIEETEEYES